MQSNSNVARVYRGDLQAVCDENNQLRNMLDYEVLRSKRQAAEINRLLSENQQLRTTIQTLKEAR